MLNLTIAQIKPLTSRISEFTLVASEPDAGPLPGWAAGAHIDIETDAGSRSYSLISWPGGEIDKYQIAVQREDDGEGGSRAMHALTKGDTVTATSPANDFALVADSKPVALLAGGIGVTPLISMATGLTSQNRPFKFHYAGRSADQMAWLEKLQSTFGSTFQAHPDDAAPLDLNAFLTTISDHSLYICGPKGMIDAARIAAEAVGIAPEYIHVELFTTAAPETGDTAFEIEVSSTGQVVTVRADQTIVDALEEAGLDPMYDCQRGDCGICQTDVVSGTPDHRDVVLSQAERDSGKVMQICVSRAFSDRLVLDL